MHNKTLRLPVAALTGTALLALGGCQDNVPELPDGPKDGPVMTVSLQNPDGSPQTGLEVELYQFAGGTLKKKLIAGAPGQEETSIVFAKEEESRIYALSGYTIEALEGTTTEADFSTAKLTSPAGAESAPMFYSSVTDAGDQNQLSIHLVRGVSRIDIANADPDLAIETVKVEGAKASTFLFPAEGKTCESDTVSYTRTYAQPLTGTAQGVFTLFESASKVSLIVTGTVKGNRSVITADIPSIGRNKVYTLRFSPEDAPEDPANQPVTIKPEIIVSDWQDGDGVSPGPDIANGLTLDLENSKLPAGVSYDQATGTLHVPASGAEDLRLAFRSDMRVDIDTIILSGADVEKDALQGKACTVNSHTVAEIGNDIVTTHSLRILPQLICRAEYDIDIRIRKASMVSSYDYVHLKVAQHPKQIQTVRIGGKEWMCFNATSSALEDQIFPLEGTTVEQMYNEHYVDCVGNYFQYGKENSFSPWTGNDPNQFASQTRDIPWKTPGRMPLPEGYHVASAAEWKALMPNGITLPAEWMSESGDSIRGTVVTLPGTLQTPSANVNKQNLLMRYVLFESITTGAKLYVPIAGIKNNTNAEVPGYGSYKFHLRGSYWVMEDRYVWLIDYKATADKADGAVLSQNRWNYDGFMSVRGIKDEP